MACYTEPPTGTISGVHPGPGARTKRKVLVIQAHLPTRALPVIDCARDVGQAGHARTGRKAGKYIAGKGRTSKIEPGFT